ncbi:hypothetical protein ASD58_10805 [Duganella sp. Root1480D1]|nr:hypothetical protein ASD58_10805 [Duganella sp. Root1480D1]
MRLKTVLCVTLLPFVLSGCSSSVIRNDEPLKLFVVRNGVAIAGPLEVPADGLSINQRFDLRSPAPSGTLGIKIYADVAFPIKDVVIYHCSATEIGGEGATLFSIGEMTTAKVSPNGTTTLRCARGINLELKAAGEAYASDAVATPTPFQQVRGK